MVGVWYRRKLRDTREASNDGRVRVCIIHGLNISHKELTYLLQKSISHRNKVLRACSQGERLVGKDHRLSLTATHKEDNQKINHAPTSSHNGSPYVHATGITNFNTSISQIQNYSTSMTLILSPPYLKTIIMLQSFLSIQHIQKKVSQILNTKHIIIKQITMLLRDSQNNLSES